MFYLFLLCESHVSDIFRCLSPSQDRFLPARILRGRGFARLLADRAFGRGGVEWDNAAITIPAP